MKKFVFLFSLCFIFYHSNGLLGQDKKPKVALVLSGGGAKGIAHIPVMEVLDSLGIIPDLVIGTSMGSIIGGLYALGYSGDSISTLVEGIDWGKMLSGDVSLLNVSSEEKSEFGKYLLDLDFNDGQPKLNKALIKDQNLREYFTILTFPSHGIRNFDELSIPYRAVAADIVNGEEVVIEEGSLYMAMRASMAIPSIFTPVEYNNTLLVDGGVLNNFPTDVAKEMGADFIIGSDVGGGLLPKEELENVVSLLFQTSMLNSKIKNPENRKLCDILIDHVPHVPYSTGDFAKSNEIYESGKIATQISVNELAVLANKLKRYTQRKRQFPEYSETFVLDTIAYTGISDGNIGLVKSRVNLQTNTPYTIQSVIDRVDLAMGTNLLNEISYKSFIDGDKFGLELHGKEREPLRLKGSLHYDVFRGVGVLLNVTTRNFLGDPSRTLFTLDVAEQPSFRLQHQKYFGHDYKWWWRSEAFGQRLKQNMYVSGERADDFRYQYLQFDNQMNKSLNNKHSYIGLGLNYEYTNAKPIINPEINDNILSLERYQFHNLEVYLRYSTNTLNKSYFPTQGTFLNVTLSRSLYPYANIAYSQDSISDLNGKTENFTKLNASYEKRFLFDDKLTGILQASAGFTFVDSKSADVSFLDFSYAANYFLGGNILRPRKDDYIFRGLNESELYVTQFMMLNMGAQISPANNIYLTPHFNIASIGYENFNDYISSAFSPSGNWTENSPASIVVSTGVTASYMSILGPIDLDFSWINDVNKIRIFFGIGYQINRSN
jgi:NTE family protein